MPTNQNAYNSRVTDEALEKRFRDTFRSQGGAELVGDLYASGVIVPIVDFTAAATGTSLAENLQTAWDSTTGSAQVNTTTSTLITNAGFWLVALHCTVVDIDTGSVTVAARVWIDDGATETNVWGVSRGVNTEQNGAIVAENKFVVFLRSGDSLQAITQNNSIVLDIWYRQIATVSGDLIDPSGFTSS